MPILDFLRRNHDLPVPAGTQVAAAIQPRLEDGSGWTAWNYRSHDYDPARVQEIYADALDACRRNPIAMRIIAITTNYVVGEGVNVSSPRRDVQAFIDQFWKHPKNQLDLRLEAMCDELARAGDLFVLLFRNPQDGMSYLRFVTKDRVLRIETAPNDYETELAYHVRGDAPLEERAWLSPFHPQAEHSEAIMLHYAVNRPLGALLGDSDLVTMLPWLQRYTRLLEDRVRLNWAMRTFLWIVTVPGNKVREKAEQYRGAPDAGSVIVKDDSEKWEPVSPLLHSTDAQSDLRAVRQMIDAGSGYPPHWRAEPFDTNLATAYAMQEPTERHLARRQRYFLFVLQDILFHAFRRAAALGPVRRSRREISRDLIHVQAPEVTRNDNERLANAANMLSLGLGNLTRALREAESPSLKRTILRLVLRFAGEPASDDLLKQILEEMEKPS